MENSQIRVLYVDDEANNLTSFKANSCFDHRSENA